MSNSVIEAMKTRRSCRKFKADPVPRELVEQIAEAGLWAASGMGKQAAKIGVVTDKDLRDRLVAPEFPDAFEKFAAFAQRLADRLDEERRAPPAAADGAGPAPALHDAGFLAV